MELEFDKVLKLPILNIGDIKNNVGTCRLSIISRSDKFVYALGIEYIDEKEEKYKIGYIGRMLAYEVLHKDGMTTASWAFPIDPSISKEEIVISTGIVPYSNIKTGKIEPATLELQKQDIKQEFLGKMVTVESFPLLSFR